MDSNFGNQVGAVDLSLFDPLSPSAAASYPLTAPTSPKTRPPEQLSNLQPQSNAPHCSQSSPAPSEQPVTTEHCPILKLSNRSDPLALNHPTLPQHPSLKSVYIAPTPTLPHQPPSPNPAFLPKIIINSAPTKLIFDSENVDYFFQRFESLHRHEQLSNAELFDQLLQCLNYQQLYRMHNVLSDGICNYFKLKNALIKTYGRTLDQAQEELAFAPGLGDQMPSELLARLRGILGRHLKQNILLQHTLRREFLARLPTYARDPLLLMENVEIDKMAEYADSLVGDRKRRHEYSNPALPRPCQQPDNYSSTTVPSNSDTPVMVEILKLLESMNKKLNEAPQTNPTRQSNPIPNPAPRPLAHRSSNNFSGIPSHKPPQAFLPKRNFQSSSRTIPSHPPNLCWYHQTYGNEARRCTPDCFHFSDWRNKFNPSSRSLNYRGGAPHQPSTAAPKFSR